VTCNLSGDKKNYVIFSNIVDRLIDSFKKSEMIEILNCRGATAHNSSLFQSQFRERTVGAVVYTVYHATAPRTFFYNTNLSIGNPIIARNPMIPSIKNILEATPTYNRKQSATSPAVPVKSIFIISFLHLLSLLFGMNQVMSLKIQKIEERWIGLSKGEKALSNYLHIRTYISNVMEKHQKASSMHFQRIFGNALFGSISVNCMLTDVEGIHYKNLVFSINYKVYNNIICYMGDRLLNCILTDITFFRAVSLPVTYFLTDRNYSQ